jgi:ubiquitin-protein ligase
METLNYGDIKTHKNNWLVYSKPRIITMTDTGDTATAQPTQPATKVTIPRETVMRLLKDIRGVVTDTTLEECGIMYQHSETDMLTGYACIVGPSDSLYFGGYYFFVFKFPTNYPHSPPIVSYLTNTNNIRFHPNFYANKKVCASIVNTWRGEQWSGCQNIRSVLMTFQSLLDKEPLLHEPGIRSGHSDFVSYHTIVEYYNYKFACLTLLTELTTYITIESTLVPGFQEFMRRKFQENKTRIREILVEREKTHPERKTVTIGLYGGMHTTISYPTILAQYDAILTSLQ